MYKFLILLGFLSLTLFADSPNFDYSKMKLHMQQERLELEKKYLFESIILPKLQNYNKNSFFVNKKNSEITHTLVKTYDINKKEILFLISSAPEDFGCHACIPKMNWFNLINEKNQWKIKSNIINKETNYGSWGQFVAPELIINKKLIIFKYSFSYSNQGFSYYYLMLESYHNGKFKQIFNDDFGFSDEGAYDIPKNNWEAKMTFINGDKKEIPDILIEKKGLKDSNNYHEKKIYSFRNMKYILK